MEQGGPIMDDRDKLILGVAEPQEVVKVTDYLKKSRGFLAAALLVGPMATFAKQVPDIITS